MTFVPLLLSIFTSLFQPQEATLVFAGDAMQHQAQIDAARRSDGSYDYSNCFTAIKPYISQADYSVVNLETPIADSKYSGYPCFNAPQSYVDALANAGFDLFLTANNHTLDRRDNGLRQTIKHLEERHLDHIGTYLNQANRKRAIPFIKDVNSFKIGFLNYTYGTNGFKVSTDAVVDYIDRKQIASDIKATRDAGAEIVVVCMHWGDEYRLLPNATQKSLADFLIEQDVDMIIGGHPHVIQPAKIVKNKKGRNVLLVYSLGNFISNMTVNKCRGGMLIKTKLVRNGDGKAQIDSSSYRLVFTLTPDKKNRNFRLVPIDEDTDIKSVAGALENNCRTFIDSALKIFNEHNISVPRSQ